MKQFYFIVLLLKSEKGHAFFLLGTFLDPEDVGAILFRNVVQLSTNITEARNLHNLLRAPTIVSNSFLSICLSRSLFLISILFFLFYPPKDWNNIVTCMSAAVDGFWIDDKIYCTYI
jgi:hypothetical protein